MEQFKFTIKDPEGIHARPAGAIVSLAKSFTSSITISKDGKTADGKRIFGLMGLCCKQNDEIIVCITGEDEKLASEKLLECFTNNL